MHTLYTSWTIPLPPDRGVGVGLFENLRVLCGSDIGANVRGLRNDLAALRSEIDDLQDLNERRWRKLRKRAADDDGEPVGERSRVVPMRSSGNPRIDRLRARRARRRLIGEAGEEAEA